VSLSDTGDTGAHSRATPYLARTRLLSFSNRALRLGPASLAAALIGGLILALVGIDVLAGPMDSIDPGDPTSKLKPEPFLVGSRWSLQTWIAITGVGFRLTGHGFSQAYVHLFDWWCSRRAHSSAGLDYARYLNTQPRAPVAYGVRGFPAFSTLRYFIIALSATLSISYKFGFEQIYVAKTETVNNTILAPLSRSGNMTTLGSSSETLPWLSDIPQYPYNRQFLHKPASLPDDYVLDEQGWGSFAEHKESWQRYPPQLVVMVEEDQTSGRLAIGGHHISGGCFDSLIKGSKVP
jgi:hypothetical protein